MYANVYYLFFQKMSSINVSLKASPIAHLSRLGQVFSQLTSSTPPSNVVNLVTSHSEIVPVDRWLLGMLSPHLLQHLLSSSPSCVSPSTTLLITDFTAAVVRHLVNIITTGFTR